MWLPWFLLVGALAAAPVVDGARGHCAGVAHVGAEIAYNGVDDDCDRATPDNDLDGDGRLLTHDCDDRNAHDDTVQVSGSWQVGTSGDLCAQGDRVSVAGDVTVGQQVLGLAGLECLCGIGGSLKISGTRNLRQLGELDALRAIGGDVVITDNEALGSVALPGLERVDGSIIIEGNPELRVVSDLGGLRGIGGDLRASGNPKLDEFDDPTTRAHIVGTIEMAVEDVREDIERRARERGDPQVRTDLLAERARADAELVGGMADEAWSFYSQDMSALRWGIFAVLGVSGALGVLGLLPFINAWAGRTIQYEAPVLKHIDESAFAHLSFERVEDEPDRKFPKVLDDLPTRQRMEAHMHLLPAAVELGDVLMEQGAEDAALAWVVHGELEVQVNGVTVGQTRVEEVVGELSVFEHASREAQVRGAMASRIVVVTREAYETMVRADNPMALRLEQAVLRSMGRRLVALCHALVRKRLKTRQPVRPASPDRRALRLRDYVASAKPLVATPKDPRKALTEAPAFNHMGPAELTALAQEMFLEESPANEVLFEQGQSGAAVHLIVSGHCEMLYACAGTTKLLRTDDLHPGDLVGLGGVLCEDGHVASCVTRSTVTLLTLDRGPLVAWMKEDSDMGRALRVALIRVAGAICREGNQVISDAIQGGSQRKFVNRARPLVRPQRDEP